MSNETKPGPCPACGKVGEVIHTVVCGDGAERTYYLPWCDDEGGGCGLQIDNPRLKTEAEAIAAWNGIRVRMLREAAEIVRAADTCLGYDCCAPAAYQAIRAAADRAERGEA